MFCFFQLVIKPFFSVIEALIQTDLVWEYIFLILIKIDLLDSAYHLSTNNDLQEIDKLMISL